MQFLIRFLSTGLFTGYIPVAPGTAGSLLAVLILILFPTLSGMTLLWVVVLTFIIGIRVSTEMEKTAGHDASIINIDEIAGLWITFLFIPQPLGWIGWAAGFAFFRLFDILKPFPINKSQSLPKGLGVMADDMISGIIANLLLRLLLIYI